MVERTEASTIVNTNLIFSIWILWNPLYLSYTIAISSLVQCRSWFFTSAHTFPVELITLNTLGLKLHRYPYACRLFGDRYLYQHAFWCHCIFSSDASKCQQAFWRCCWGYKPCAMLASVNNHHAARTWLHWPPSSSNQAYLSSQHREASPPMTFCACSSPAPTAVKPQPTHPILQQESIHTTLSITHHTRMQPFTNPRTTQALSHRHRLDRSGLGSSGWTTTRVSTPPNPTPDLPILSTDLHKTLRIVRTPHGHSITKIRTC
jgi:hypothetical protein